MSCFDNLSANLFLADNNVHFSWLVCHHNKAKLNVIGQEQAKQCVFIPPLPRSTVFHFEETQQCKVFLCLDVDGICFNHAPSQNKEDPSACMKLKAVVGSLCHQLKTRKNQIPHLKKTLCCQHNEFTEERNQLKLTN